MLGNTDTKLVKVLIVENDEVNICVADSFLYACGYKNVVVARNGKEALKQFKNGVGFILMNVNLPDASGLEVCKKLRQMPRGKSIAIVAFAPKGKEIRAKCFKVGMNDVMSGPTSFKGFKSMMQRSLG